MAQVEKRLVGEDAILKLDDALTEIISAASTVAGTFYRVKAKGGSTALPAALSVGDWFIGPATPLTLASGDILQVSDASTYLDIKSYSVSFSKSEIDTTVLADEVKAVRAGKSSATGSFEGNRIIEALDASGQVTRNKISAKFLNVITQDGTTYTRTGEGNDDILWFFLFLNDTDTTGDVKEVMILPIRLTSLEPVSVSVDGVQTFNGSFSVDGSLKPCLLQYEVPA